MLAALLVCLGGCARVPAATEPPPSALPHAFPALEARLPATWSGLPALRASYDGESAVGDEDLYGRAFSVLAGELVGTDASATVSPDYGGLEVAEAWLGAGHPNDVVVRAYRLPGAPVDRWTAVLDALVAGRASLEWRYRFGPDQARPTLLGTATTPGGDAALVVASGDTLYELTGRDAALLSTVAAALP